VNEARIGKRALQEIEMPVEVRSLGDQPLAAVCLAEPDRV
jgi:hypothetical protein